MGPLEMVEYEDRNFCCHSDQSPSHDSRRALAMSSGGTSGISPGRNVLFGIIRLAKWVALMFVRKLIPNIFPSRDAVDYVSLIRVQLRGAWNSKFHFKVEILHASVDS